MKLSLVRPTYEMKDKYMKFLSEWENNNEEIIPYSARLLNMTYEKWVDYILICETNAPKELVNAHTLFVLNSNQDIIGAVNIRHTLNDYLLNYGGHIGYGISPKYRGNGYAKKILSQAITFSRDLGLNDILITCNANNTLSSKTIISNNGILENEVYENEYLIQRYWIYK